MAEYSDTRVVTLTDDEYFAAMVAGCMRRASGRAKGRKHRSNRDIEGVEFIDLVGAIGEACVAKYLDRYWLGPGVVGGMDVADVQVRTTTYKNGCLILHDDDNSDSRFILVYAVDGVGHLRGWCYGREGKQQLYLQDKGGRGEAYFVPVSALHPLPSREQIKKRREKHG